MVYPSQPLKRLVPTFNYLMSNSTATASAAANIALVKYWGKASIGNNQPATGSVSLGLEDLRTTTTLEYATGNRDTFDTELDDNNILCLFFDIFRFSELNNIL